MEALGLDAVELPEEAEQLSRAWRKRLGEAGLS
jgi:hypothetical protein